MPWCALQNGPVYFGVSKIPPRNGSSIRWVDCYMLEFSSLICGHLKELLFLNAWWIPGAGWYDKPNAVPSSNCECLQPHFVLFYLTYCCSFPTAFCFLSLLPWPLCSPSEILFPSRSIQMLPPFNLPSNGTNEFHLLDSLSGKLFISWSPWHIIYISSVAFIVLKITFQL